MADGMTSSDRPKATPKSRRSAGVPAGGQFAEAQRAASGVALGHGEPKAKSKSRSTGSESRGRDKG